MALRQRSGVQLPPSGKMTRALRRPMPAARRLICSVCCLAPARASVFAVRCRNAFGRRLARMSTLGSSCSVAFMTTRGLRPHTLSR